jgi:hypothetical protein
MCVDLCEYMKKIQNSTILCQEFYFEVLINMLEFYFELLLNMLEFYFEVLLNMLQFYFKYC